VVYVSCNSATQARDLALMDEIQSARVRPVDMFPQTHRGKLLEEDKPLTPKEDNMKGYEKNNFTNLQ
jgi:hypothetical protein